MVLTLEELMRLPRYRRAWGGWTLNHRSRTLHHPGQDYEVDLDRCRTAGQVLDWIAQIGGKLWANDATLAGFVRALDDVLRLQANLCPGGICSRLLDRATVKRLVHDTPGGGR